MKRHNKKESLIFPRPNRLSLLKPPSSKIKSAANKQVMPGRRSSTWRISSPAPDDSIALMNIGLEDESSKPAYMGEISLITIDNFNGGSSCNSSLNTSNIPASTTNLGCKLSEETLQYLQKLNVKKLPGPLSKPSSHLSPMVEVSELCDSKDTKISTYAQTDYLIEHCKMNHSELRDKVQEILLRQCKEREALNVEFLKKMEELQKNHDQEIKDCCRQKENILKPLVQSSALETTCEKNNQFKMNLKEDSFLSSPCSGIWRVSAEVDMSILGDTPVGLNSFLEDMTMNNQNFVDTPVTRTLSTKRILKGMENLFM